MHLKFSVYNVTEDQKASRESKLGATHQEERLNDERPDSGEDSDDDGDHTDPVEEIMEEDFQKFTGRKKRLWELRQKMVSLFSSRSHNFNNYLIYDGLKV